MSQKSNQAAAGLLVIGLVAAAFHVVGSNPLITGVLGMAQANREWQAEGARAAYERNYTVICPRYRDAGFATRWASPWMWENAWCADYLDRLPPKEQS
ncbi:MULTISPECIES: hypothetical protein [unclassified Rhizobium]|uniref:hypothetical protein n=1 Tax=unclassified Rhizobium TaxID=2613769 RepID=UPI0007EB5C7B|nr:MULTISPECIES: hypothetical protein [unclassified Rhizobium]ANL11990.1 hypothetical protein AMJ98_PA00044 [Rhizobium sp. N1341]ANM42835.1 hypothetical protein AMK03_PA00044 [Rhizobium sp. N741]